MYQHGNTDADLWKWVMAWCYFLWFRTYPLSISLTPFLWTLSQVGVHPYRHARFRKWIYYLLQGYFHTKRINVRTHAKKGDLLAEEENANAKWKRVRFERQIIKRPASRDKTELWRNKGSGSNEVRNRRDAVALSHRDCCKMRIGRKTDAAARYWVMRGTNGMRVPGRAFLSRPSK